MRYKDTPEGHMYEVATWAMIKEEFPRKTPVPFGTRNGRND